MQCPDVPFELKSTRMVVRFPRLDENLDFELFYFSRIHIRNTNYNIILNIMPREYL